MAELSPMIVDPTGGGSDSGVLYGPWDEKNRAEAATAAAETKTRSNPGRKAAKKAPAAQQRKDKPVVYGKADRAPSLLRRFRWRALALRDGFRPELLTTAESMSWSDEDAIMTGTMTVRDAAFGVGSTLELREGDRVRLYMDGGGGFKPIWTMRIYAPSRAVKEGTRAFKLANDLDLLRRSTDDFVFAKDRAHPNGWTGDEMIREICRLYGVPIAAIPKFKFRRKKRVTYGHRRQGSTGLVGLFKEICNVELQHTGRRYAIRWEQDALWITPFVRSPHLLALGPSLLDAAFESALPQEDPPSSNSFASAITIRSIRDVPAGTDTSGKKKSTGAKVRVDLESPATRRRYGYVHRVVWSPDADTLGELREHGLQYLALIAKPVKTLTLTHAGMPELRRGDAIRLGIGDDALLRQVVWVQGLQYTLTPSDFTMSVTAQFDDPYVDKREERIGKLLAGTSEEAAATRRGQKPAPAGSRGHADGPTPGEELTALILGSNPNTVDPGAGGRGGR